ncbi:MAG: response regulator transcription factor [Candidatus Sulfotelmatobacter sp.]
MELLVVEDERRMLELLRKGLSREGHRVACAGDGCEGLQKIRKNRFDIVVLDVMMPKMDGFEMARCMRMEENQTPILMLTAKDTVPDIVHALELGADDYIFKPFSFNELLLRIRAINRRATASLGTKLKVGDLLMDVSTHRVYRGGIRISLTRTEYVLLETLMRNAGRAVRREDLITSLGRQVGGNTLEAFVRLLRNKIDCDVSRKLIHTVRAVGYIVSSECDT